MKVLDVSRFGRRLSSAMQKFVRPALIVSALIGLAAVSRLIPHPPNFTATAAVALFAGYYFYNTRAFAWLVPMLAMLVSNVIIGGYDFWQMLLVNIAMILPVFAGPLLRRDIRVENPVLRSLLSGLRVAAFSVAGSVVFFALSNLAVWGFSGMYEHSLSGLAFCYLVALPFLENDGSMRFALGTLTGDLFYNGVIFGVYALATARSFIFATEAPRAQS